MDVIWGTMRGQESVLFFDDPTQITRSSIDAGVSFAMILLGCWGKGLLMNIAIVIP